MNPSRSRAKEPPTKTRTRLVSVRAITTIVETTSIALRRRKLRPVWTSKTTFSARRQDSSTPVVP
jgi:hypothetical protein